jgi:hypothetical protein
MFKALEGFRSFKTYHCVTGSLRHVYEFHRYTISEDLLLGLDSGVGFVCWHMKDAISIIKVLLWPICSGLKALLNGMTLLWQSFRTWQAAQNL